MIPDLMFITDASCDLGRIELACQSGLPSLQLRDKTQEVRPVYELAIQLRKITAKSNTLFIINERFDVALAVEADGVHLPEKGISPQVVKKTMPSFIVGVSVHSLEAALLAQEEGADYVMLGPIFPTPNKGPPQGKEALQKICSQLKIPVIAVGGITPDLAKVCLDAGASGIAAISAFQESTDIQATIRSFHAHSRSSFYY